MKGSAKQIKWAEEIRDNLIAKVKQAFEDCKANPKSTPDVIETSRINGEILIDGLKRIDNASYFIDNRFDENTLIYKAMEIGQFNDIAEDSETADAESTADTEADKVEQVYVMVPKERVFKTRYGWGLIVDRNHVQWLDKQRVNMGFTDGRCEVTLRRDEWNPKTAKRPYADYDANDNETKWSTWVAREES